MEKNLGLYATVEDFESYMGSSWETDDPTALADTIRKAERDIDEYLGVAAGASGYVYDPSSLDTLLSSALTRAVCGQTEYRLAMGEPFFSGVTFGQEGPDVTLKRTPPRVSPYAKRELVRAGLVSLTGRFL